VFTFKGDAAEVEGTFQAVGFATQLGVSVPDDGSETHQVIHVAPRMMVADTDSLRRWTGASLESISGTPRSEHPDNG
jgi:hypothetical protein